MWYMKPHKLLLCCGIFLVICGYSDGKATQSNKPSKGKFVSPKNKKQSQTKGAFVSPSSGNRKQTKSKGGFVYPSSKNRKPNTPKGGFVNPGFGKNTKGGAQYGKPKGQFVNISNRKNKKSRQSKSKDKSSKPSVKVFTCPSSSIQMNCLSCRTRIYRKCPVVDASRITEVRIMTEYKSSYNKCIDGRTKKENFGINDRSNIWVDVGCRARFLICYEKALKEPKTVNCGCDIHSSNKCPLQLKRSNILVRVSLLFRNGNGRCKEHATWGYDDRAIWVKNGCSATFQVFWQ